MKSENTFHKKKDIVAPNRSIFNVELHMYEIEYIVAN